MVREIVTDMFFLSQKSEPATKDEAKTYVTLLCPFAPHLCEELWEYFGGEGFCSYAKWPEYDEAKNEQGIVESRIAEIEATLAHAQVIDSDDITTEKVGIGTVVKILDKEMDEEMEFQIVGTSEANIDKGQMSDESPIGAALIGHKVGEAVDVETPSGIIQFEILEISKKEEE